MLYLDCREIYCARHCNSVSYGPLPESRCSVTPPEKSRREDESLSGAGHDVGNTRCFLRKSGRSVRGTAGQQT